MKDGVDDELQFWKQASLMGCRKLLLPGRGESGRKYFEVFLYDFFVRIFDAVLM